MAKRSHRPVDEAQALERTEAGRRAEPIRATHVHVDLDPARPDSLGLVGARPWWLWGFDHGVNDAGLVAGDLSAPADGSGPRAEDAALVAPDLVRLALERASSAGEAVEVVGGLVERWGVAAGPGSLLVADAGEAWVVDVDGHGCRAERAPADDDGATVADLRRRLRDAGQAAGALVAELGIERPATARFLLGPPATSVFVPLFVHRPLGMPVAWQRFATLTGRADVRPALDELEAGLEADARDDEDWAFEAWRRVDRTLRSLGG